MTVFIEVLGDEIIDVSTQQDEVVVDIDQSQEKVLVEVSQDIEVIEKYVGISLDAEGMTVTDDGEGTVYIN